MNTASVRHPYIGFIVRSCMLQAEEFRHAAVIVVSGAAWNPCGHTLLRIGGTGGMYFHVAEVRGMPRAMQSSGYERYLKDHDKSELKRTVVHLPDPGGAHLMLEMLLAKRWNWFALPNNCASFVEDVVRAGGSSAGLYFNCPSQERFV